MRTRAATRHHVRSISPLAQHEPPRGGDEFVGSPSVSASAEAQGSDTSDAEPADGLGGLYTWDWLDDAEAFVLGGDVQ